MMSWQWLRFVCLLALCVYALPEDLGMQGSNNDPVVPQARKVECKITHKSGVNPRSEDCANAMYRLSDSNAWQNFDTSSLPVKETHQTCIVDVFFQRSTEDFSSWLNLQIAANRLLAACSYSGTFRSHVGGTVWDGRSGRIAVRFSRNQALGSQFGNLTISNSTSLRSQSNTNDTVPEIVPLTEFGGANDNLSVQENVAEVYRNWSKCGSRPLNHFKVTGLICSAFLDSSTETGRWSNFMQRIVKLDIKASNWRKCVAPYLMFLAS